MQRGAHERGADTSAAREGRDRGPELSFGRAQMRATAQLLRIPIIVMLVIVVVIVIIVIIVIIVTVVAIVIIVIT